MSEQAAEVEQWLPLGRTYEDILLEPHPRRRRQSHH